MLINSTMEEMERKIGEDVLMLGWVWADVQHKAWLLGANNGTNLEIRWWEFFIINLRKLVLI